MSDAVDEALALAARLPGAAIHDVFARYGKPIDVPDDAAPGPALALVLGDGSAATLRLWRIRTAVDVIANDWFVLESPGVDSLAMPGPLFAAAIAALTRAAARRP